MSKSKMIKKYWRGKRNEGKIVIAQYLMESFSDEKLSQLREDAVAGLVPFMSTKHCLVGHSDTGWLVYQGDDAEWDARRKERLQHSRASSAYCTLGFSEKWEDSDQKRCKRLLHLIDAEIERRAALKAEAVAKAVETCSITEGELAYDSNGDGRDVATVIR